MDQGAGAPDRQTGALDAEVVTAVLDAVLQRSGTGVVVFDHELRYVLANDVTAAINDIPAEDHVGRSLWEVVPDVADEIAPVLRRVLDTGEPELRHEVTGRTASTPARPRSWLSDVVRLDPPGQDPLVAVVFTEVTREREAHLRLRRLIDNLFTFVGLLDPDGTLTEANRTALEAGGLTLDEVVGRPFWDTPWWDHDPAVREQLRSAVARAARGESSRYDAMIRVESGLVPIDFMLAPIVEEGEVVALVPSGLEITARVEQADRLAALAGLSNRLNAAVSTADVVAAVLHSPDAVEDASFVNVALVDADAKVVRISMDEVDPDIVERWATMPLEGDTPIHRALRTGRIEVVADRDDRRRRYPHLLADSDRLGLHATAAVPLLGTDGTAFGAIGLGWSHPLDPAAEVRSRLELLGDICSQALQRSRRTGAFTDLVRSLQAELLPTARSPSGVEVAVEYRPAVNDIGFGGDWYDIVELDGATAFVVGDVAGHGVAAAATMAQAKGVLRALVIGTPLDRVLADAGRALAGGSVDLVGTAAVVVLDEPGRELRWVSAGHPPPILRRADGTVEVLTGGRGMPIGVGRGPIEPGHLDVGAGALLVLYTDGLVERRTRPVRDGLEELRRAVTRLPADVSAAAARTTLLDRMVDGGAHDDDVAIIVVRIERAPGLRGIGPPSTSFSR